VVDFIPGSQLIAKVGENILSAMGNPDEAILFPGKSREFV